MSSTSRALFLASLVLLPAAGPQAARFVRGDLDASGELEITDAVRTLGHLFLGEPRSLSCEDAADANDDGGVDIGDAVFSLGYLFLGGAAPHSPFAACGDDPSTDALGCAAFSACASGPADPLAELEAAALAAPATVEGLLQLMEVPSQAGLVRKSLRAERGGDWASRLMWSFVPREARGDGQGGAAQACPIAGSADQSCLTRGSESQKQISFSNCIVPEGENAVILSGKLTITGDKLDVCGTAPNSPPAGASVQVHFDGFQAKLVSPQGQVLESASIDLRLELRPEAAGCGGEGVPPVGSISLDGSIVARTERGETSLRIDELTLQVDLVDDGGICKLVLGVNGGIEINDTAQARRLAQSVRDVRVEAYPDGNGDVCFTLGGEIADSCLGGWTRFSTPKAICIEPGESCPFGGELKVAPAAGGQGRIIYRADRHVDVEVLDAAGRPLTRKRLASCQEGFAALCGGESGTDRGPPKR